MTLRRRRVLGIDPGSRVVGYGILDVVGRDVGYVECGILRAVGQTRDRRIASLVDDLLEIVDEFRPDEAGIELAFVGKFPASALALAEARGALRDALRRRGIPFGEWTPGQAKKIATGRGHASKVAVSDALVRALSIPGRPRLDATDALAIALTQVARGRVGEGSRRGG